jgi:hypothetical protein
MFRYPNIYKRNRLEFGGAIAQTATPELAKRKNNAYRLYVTYPNDRLSATVSARRIEPNFNPEVGYVARYGSVVTAAASYRFRNIGLGLDNIYVKPFDMTQYYDVDEKVETIRYAFTPLNVLTTSGDFVGLNVNRNFDRLDFNYPLIKDVVLPKGEHWYNEYQCELGSSRVRDVYGYGFLSTGDFYGGKRHQFYAEGGARVNRHLFCSASYDWNDVEIERRRAITSNIGTHVDYSFNTQWLTSLFVQWNDLDERLGMNVRLHWIPNIGSDVYLAYNQTLNTDHDFEIENATILCKVSYRIVV